MNKIYKTYTVKNRSFFSSFLSKKIILIFIGLLGMFSNLQAQVSVTATAGVVGPTPYTTVQLAFAAVNAGTHRGVITVSINGNTTESSMAILNSSGTGSANYTSVLVRPTVNATVTGNLATAVIQLFGADNVTIDGLNAANQLTISNSSASTGSAVVWVGSASATDGATNNTIKNCIIVGNAPTTTLIGIASSSGTTIGGLAEAANSGNTYQNNTINTCQIGISVTGPNGNESNNVISNNTIGSAIVGNKLGHKGISVFQQQNVLISQNTIFGLTSIAGSFTFQVSGIYVGGTITGGLVDRNKISDVKIESFWGCDGILLQTNTSNTGLTVSNNFVFDVAAGGFTEANTIDDNGFGIAIDGGGGYKIYYNSVDLSTNQLLNGSSITPGPTAAFWISSLVSGTVDVRNNIFSNRETTGTRFSIYSNVSNTVFSTVNYNDYFSTGSVGFMGSASATLAAWQTASGQDANSLAVDPVFTSVVDLHLQGSSPLDGFAVVIPSVTSDIDGQVRNATTPDIGADEFTPPNCSANTAGTASATFTNICASGTSTLSATGYAFGAGISYQWQSSPDNITFSNIVGQTNPTSSIVGPLGATTYFRLKVTCSNCCGGAAATSNVITITVNNPQVTSTTPATRCGVGTVNLGATAATGSLNWYAASSGGTSLFTGSPFTTPVISSTTTYYVSNTIVNGFAFVGPLYSGSSANGVNVGNHGIAITTTVPSMRINSADIAFTGTGTFTVSLKDITNTTVYSSYTTASVTGSGTTAVTVPLSINISNAGNYLLIVDAVSGTIGNLGYIGTASYPYSALGGSFNITSGYWYGTDPSDNMYLFNLNVSSICEGLRTPVTATITSPPAFTTVSPAAGAPRTICSGSCVNLNVTSSNGAYVYTWNPGALAGAAHSVCPTVTTTYTVTANDGVCRRDSAITITVYSTPTALSVNPATATSCPGTLIPITATGGQLFNQTAFSENFETFPLTQFTVTGTGVTAVQNTTYFQQGTSSVQLTYGNSIDGQLAMSNSINLANYTSPTLTFYQICATEGGFDYGYVQYSSDGGTSWHDFAPADYTGGGTLHGVGGIGFDKTSYSDWNTQFTSATSTPGTGPATSLWKLETINLAPYISSTFKIRFRLTSDVSALYYGWLIDNVNITGNTQANITWNPITNLYLSTAYTNASSVGTTITCTSTTGLLVGMPVVMSSGTGTFQGGTVITSILNGTQFTVNLVPSVALSAAVILAGYIAAVPTATTVWSIPAGSITYTATATNGVCSSSATSVITTSAAAASVTISASPGLTICQGSPVTFTATPVNGGGNPGFKWFVNNVQVNAPLGNYNANPGNNPYTIYGLANGDKVYCQILSNAGGCVVPNNPSSSILTMIVNPTPSVSIDGPLTVCFPSILTLTTGGTITGYEWFLNGSTTGIVTPTYNAIGPGTYSCVVTSNQGCKDTSADKVLAQQTYTITATATNGSISPSGAVVVNCGANQSFTYTANPGFQVCDVLIDGVSVGTPASPYVFTNVTANHTIDIQFCNPGCASVYTAFAGSDASICGNTNYTLASGSPSISSTPNVGLTATWSTSIGGDGTFFPGNAFGVATTYTPGPSDITNGTVDLILTTNDPLGSPCAPAAASMTLTIKPFPVVTITGQLGICSAGTTSTTLTASATITSGSISGYTWTGGIAPFNVASHTYNAAGGPFTNVTNASNGCSTTTPITIASFTSPSTPTITGTGTICIGTTTNLTANVASPGNGGATILGTGYQWFNGPSIGGAINQVYTAGAIGTYTVTVTNSNGCLSTASAGFPVAYDNSPLNGAYTIGVGPASCTNYLTFAAAISDLNTRTISGNVRFDIPAGYTETVPGLGLSLGSAALNATVAGRTITFNKNGVGANPVLFAYAGGVATPGSNVPDGIWSLRGVDNVSINNIDLTDNNTTNPSTMEYGFGLFKLGATDGAQNNTIQNCTITLKRTNDALGGAVMPDGSTGIVVANSLATTANTAITPISANGANSNNKFYGNTIQNCNTGIALMGYGAPSSALGDNGNDVGGIASSTGNNIINFGGAAASTATAVGVRMTSQWGLNVSYNTINNNNGAGASHLNILRGIWGQSGGTSANISINNNNITLKSIATGAQLMAAIDNAVGSTIGGNTVTISNNTITGTYTTATGAANMTGIINSASAATVNINGNTVDSYSLPGAGNFIGISNAAINTNTTINNNILSNCNVTTTGTLVGIGNTTAGSTNLIMNGNTVTNITKTTNGIVNWMQTALTTNATINDNIITNNTVTAGATAVAVNCINGGTSIYTYNNNYIYNNSITGISGSAAVLTGINCVNAATSETITNNTVRKLFITGTATGFLHVVQGINTNTAAAAVKTISNNTIGNLYTSSTLSSTVYGIRNATGSTVNIFRNKIDSLYPGQSATTNGAYAAGMRLQSGGTAAMNVYNNFINLDLTTATAPASNAVLTGGTLVVAPFGDALRGIESTSSSAQNINIYYNTIRLAGSGSGTGFGSSCMSITGGTPPTIDLRNNIFVNLTTPGGTSPGFAAGLRRLIAVSATYATTSNNNIYYSGVPSASKVLYFDATNGVSYQTMAAFQAGAGIAPRETASYNVSPSFISATDLHLQPGKNCSSDGQAQVIAGYTGDYDADLRSAVSPDIGADEFNGTGVGLGVWAGTADNDWNNVLNWCDAVPDKNINVTIPAGAPNYPLITTATPACKNITIAANGTVTITGVGKLAIYGTISNSGTFNTVDGTIEMAGAAAQTIPVATFQNNDLKNLIISNNAGAVTLGGTLNLYGKLSYTKSNCTFATAGFLVLRSTATGTAYVGDITNAGANSGNTITGDVSVERFAGMRRAWRFLSAATQHNSQNIHQSWQEGQATNSTTPPGYGMQITSDRSTWLADGFDAQTTAGPSLKTYNPVTNAWDGIAGTVGAAGNFVVGKGYMALVRGDRTINYYEVVATTTTVLRDKGTLYTGNFTAPVGAGQFAAIGNPYASAIDFSKIPAPNKVNIAPFYYLWDPYMGALGAYVTFATAGTHTASTSYGANYYIESGQAFFVNSSGPAGSITLTEPIKVDGSYLVSRPAGAVGKQLTASLYLVDANGRNLYDGVTSEFDNSYSNTVDVNDAIKMVNFGENLGIRRDEKTLSVERMKELVETDTIFYNLNQMRLKHYQFEFTPDNISQTGLAAFLEDRYLNVKTPVSLSAVTTVDFTIVNDPGSYAPDRFRLVFMQAGPVPVTFSSIKANRQRNDILVEWKVENELNIHHYDVEKSADGHNFSKVNETAARGNGSGAAIQYNWLDTNPLDGDNFYRVRSVGISNEVKLSQIVKVNMGKLTQSITVFPNPVREDGILYISMSNQPAGNYQLTLVNTEGQTMMKKSLNHAGGNSIYTIEMDKYVAHGNYLVNIAGDNNVKLTFKIVY